MENYTEKQRFTINIDHLVPAIVDINEKLYDKGKCETHPLVTQVALKMISHDITIENIISCHKYWDEIINNNFNVILECIQYFENKYPIKLSLFREIFFSENTDFMKIQKEFYENIISMIAIASAFIRKMRKPVDIEHAIIYTEEYKDDINIEKYLRNSSK